MRRYYINFLFKLIIIFAITACGENSNHNGFISENNLTEINSTIEGNITVDGNSTIEGNITADGNSTIEGNITADGNSTIEGNITVDRNSTIEGNITADGNSTLEGNITVDGNSTLEGNITVDGNSTINKNNIQGIVQKGLFFDGVVTAHYLDAHGNFSKEYQTANINTKGEYRLYLKDNGLVVFNAKGHFFNEYKKQNSTEEAELFALVDYKSSDDVQESNLNLFTSFEYVRLLELIEKGKSYKEALKITRRDMKREFGLDENIKTTKLNIYDINGRFKNENKNLLLLSGAFLKSIDDNLSKSKRDNTFYAKFRKKDLEIFLLNFKDSGKMDGKSWTLMKKYNMSELLNRLSSNLGIEESIDSNDLQAFSWIVSSAQTLAPPRIDTTSFVTIWKTDNHGESEDKQIIIPTESEGNYLYDIDWNGDGVWDTIGATGTEKHTYPNSGIYTVKIRGQFPRIYFNNLGDKDKILSVKQWGNIVWKSMKNSFYGCKKLNIDAMDVPNLSKVLDMSGMFKKAISFNQPLNDWNVTNVTNMTNLFFDAESFNQPLNDWDVSSVIYMNEMFSEARSFNQPLNDWDVSSVIYMNEMFSEARSFNQPLNDWNVSSVTDMYRMFFSAILFNQSLNNWNVSSVTDMNGMFNEAISFDQSLSNWKIGNVTDMRGMFVGLIISLENYDNTLKNWSKETLQNDLSFDGGGSKYCLAQDARTNIINTYHWRITDGGEEYGCDAYKPVITSPNSITIKEDQNDMNFHIVATAQNNLYSLLYSIVGGDDLALFDLNKTTGILNFRATPDFEYPLDSNGDNNYSIEINVDNGYFRTSQTITISVLNVSDKLSKLPVVQKGPFILHKAKVTAYPLIQGVRDSAIKVEADIVGLQGGYHFKLPLKWNKEPQLWNSDVELVASGKYYNELTGEEDEIELSVVVKDTDINSSYPNINLLTDMEARMVKQYLKKLPFDNTYLSSYRFFAQKSISKFFDLGKNIDFAKLNLLNGKGVYKEQNAELLRLSKAILQQSVNANKQPKEILNALSDELFIWEGVELDSLMIDVDAIKEYAKEENSFNVVSNNLKRYTDIGFIPTFTTLGESIHDPWLNQNTQPIIQNFSGDIEGDMVTVFDSNVNMVHYEVLDQETTADKLWLSLSIFQYPDLSLIRPIDKDYKVGFYDYIDNLGLRFVCHDSSSIDFLLANETPYEKMVLLLKDISSSNCLLVEKDGDKADVTLPITYYNFVQGNVDTPYKKDMPFLFPISASDGQYIKKREIIILFRDTHRPNPLNNPLEILFDNDKNNYVVNGIRPTHMSWATRWSISGKPDWATFDATTGELSGTASESEMGNYDINITGYKTFSNGMIAKDTESFTLKLLSTDRVPDSFSFISQWDVAPYSSVQTSITLSGLANSAVVSLQGDGVYEILREGIKGNANRIVRNGDTITLFMRASSGYSTSKYLTLTVGGVSATWSVRTRSAPTIKDSTPNRFSFRQKNDVEFLTMQEESVTISGINTSTSIQISNGEYSLDKGATWRTSNSLISRGQVVYVRHISGVTYGARTESRLTVGGVSGSFVSVVKNSGDKATPPTLQPLVPSFYMDSDFRLNFTDSSLWRSQITKVRLVGSLLIITDINGIELNAGTDYTVFNGQLLIHSQLLHNRLGGTLMDYMGSWNIIVEAEGYESAFGTFEVTDGIPIITTPLHVSIPENQQEVQDIHAIGKGNMTFVVNVAYDGAKFSIDIITGVLRFKVAPDFETPASLENSNQYKVQVSVIGTAGTTIETIIVDVTDVANEGSNNSCDCPDFANCMAN